jgi:hypothetical protein
MYIPFHSTISFLGIDSKEIIMIICNNLAIGNFITALFLFEKQNKTETIQMSTSMELAKEL